MHVVIQNKTESSIDVKLYPKGQFRRGDMYRKVENGGGYNETEYSLSPNSEGYYRWDEALYISNDLTLLPHTLMERVFDSIYVKIEDYDETIVFSKEKVTAYSENIFSENTIWEYEIVETELPTMIKEQPQKYYCYKFIISKDKLIETGTNE